MIVTLAGHVDHGKTSLVRALTGVDTDRLQQEKDRGLTIDLGFAYIDDGNIGFVDVPGHHKFIHNMVAGVARNQYALLVVAADDGPMPQTREHLQILSLVGIRHGVIALTKTDRVDEARQAQALDEINDLVSGSFLEGATVIPTATDNLESIENLRSQLRDATKSYDTGQDQQPFRIAVDRAFNVRGAGLVVTGTAHCGQVALDDNLFHYPSGKPVRVRSIRAQDAETSTANQGERCALNITGLDLHDVNRGDWLGALPPAAFTELSVELQVIADFPRKLKHWTPVHMYHATTHSTGRIALIDGQPIEPGSAGLVDVICDTPLNARHGDQIIVRDQSLDITLGGGRVIHGRISPPDRRRSQQRLQHLACFSEQSPGDALKRLLARGSVEANEYRQIWHLDEATFQQICKEQKSQVLQGQIVGPDFLTSQAKQALIVTTQHQRNHPTSPGLRENEFTSMDPALRQSVLNGLVAQKMLANEAGYYKLPQHEAELPEELAKQWQRLQKELDLPQAPSTGDIAKSWQVPQATLEKNLKELAKRGMVTHIADHRFYLPSQLRSLAGLVTNMSAQKPVSVREFRDKTGIGRNVAIEVLEYFDRRGFTRRQGNERIVLRENL